MTNSVYTTTEKCSEAYHYIVSLIYLNRLSDKNKLKYPHVKYIAIFLSNIIHVYKK